MDLYRSMRTVSVHCNTVYTVTQCSFCNIIWINNGLNRRYKSFFLVELRHNADHGLVTLEVLYHTQRRTTVGRTPLDEWSAHCRDLYLTTHNTHSRKTSIRAGGFEPTISAGELPHGHSDRPQQNNTVTKDECTIAVRCHVWHRSTNTCYWHPDKKYL